MAARGLKGRPSQSILPYRCPRIPVEPSIPELSVVLPCLNEALSLAACVQRIRGTFEEHQIRGEVVIADNGSRDGSVAIAESMGLRVAHVGARGYGSTLQGGIALARGRYVLIGDSDGTYDFRHIPRFLERLRQGYDLVVGNRFQGGIAAGAMPRLHRYIGNPLLSLLGRLLFHVPCRDFHCGLRAFSKSAYEKLGMRSTGMEFASEMVVKAALMKLRVTEVPTTLFRDKRNRRSHLRTWRDGWRHLRFMLLYSPRWLFLYPGLALIFVGFCVGAWLLPQPRQVGVVVFDVHTLLYAMVAISVGFQAVAFGVFTRLYASRAGLLPKKPRLEQVLQGITLEAGLAVGIVLIICGLAGSLYAVHIWGTHHFGPLDTGVTLRTVLPSVTALILGCEVTLFSFFLGIFELASPPCPGP